MKTNKLKLVDLRLESFVTEVNAVNRSRIFGGDAWDRAECPTHGGSDKENCFNTGFPVTIEQCY